MSVAGSCSEFLKSIILSEFNFVPKCSTVIYGWGSGVGVNDFKKIECIPVRLNLHRNLLHSTIVSVAAGNRVSALVTDMGTCYSWGETLLGRDCLSVKDKCVPGKVHIDQGQAVVKRISYGDNYCYIQSHDGQLYEFGTTPTDSLTNHRRPARPRIFPNHKRLSCPIVDVACGQSFSITLLSNGKIRMIGTIGGITPRLKSKQTNVATTIPQNISFPQSIQHISCGLNHCVVVSSTGKCFSWGLAERLGLGPKLKGIITEPQMIPLGIDVGLVSCGATHTCLVTSDSRRLFCFGNNDYLQCGEAHTSDMDDGNILHPKEIQLHGLSIFNIHCGFAHSAITTFSGALFTWGFNDEGQLGLGHEENVGHPTNVFFDDRNVTDCKKYVVSAACGRTHTICVLSTLPPSRFRERQEHLSCLLNSFAVLKRFCHLVKQRITYSCYNEESSECKNAIEPTAIVHISHDDVSSVEEKMIQIKTISDDDDETQSIDEVSSPCDRDDHYQSLLERLDMDREDKFSKALEDLYGAIGNNVAENRVAINGHCEESENMLPDVIVSQNQSFLRSETRDKKNQVSTRMTKLNEQIKKVAERLSTYRMKKEQQKDILTFKNSDIITRKRLTKKSEDITARMLIVAPCNSDPPSKDSHTDTLLDKRRLRQLRKQELDKEVEEIKERINNLTHERRQLSAMSAATQLIATLSHQEQIIVDVIERKRRQLKELQTELNLKGHSVLDFDRVSTFTSLSQWTYTLHKRY